MSPGDPLTALTEIAGQLPGLLDEVKGLRREASESRKKITWLIRACIAIGGAALIAVGWTWYQQTVLNDKSAAISRLAHQNAALVRQNAARQAADARHAHDLCVRLNRTRAQILPVWEKVLSERPDDARLLSRVKAAEPLGDCPKAPPAGR